MVFCGRPSTSCENCRARRRRCDKAVPECGQCRRMGQHCPGYRDPTILLFRDQTSQVVEKIRLKKTRISRPPSDSRERGRLERGQSQEPGQIALASVGVVTFPLFESGSNKNILPSTSPSSIPSAVVPSLDMIALNVFLTNYVIYPSHPSPGFLDFTAVILSRNDGNGMLEGAITALGFAALANNTHEAGLMYRSRDMYTRSIEKVNKALADPHTARQDSTIVTVLILAMHEFSDSSLEYWGRHIQGAASLLILRGQAQFTTAIGRAIFRNAFSHLLTNCFRLGLPLPPRIRMLRLEAANQPKGSDPYWVATGALLDIMDLYKHIGRLGRSRSEVNLEELEGYISQAMEIDHRLESQCLQIPSEWKFKIVHSDTHPDQVFGSVYHVYHDNWVATIWNSMRAGRIMTIHAIRNLLLRGAKVSPEWLLAGHHSDRMSVTKSTLNQIRNDIIASVPQLTGQVLSLSQWKQQKKQGSSLTQTLEDSTHSFFDVPSDSGVGVTDGVFPGATLLDKSKYNSTSTGGHSLYWILYMLGSMDSTSDDMRQWIVKTLRRASVAAGIGQAAVFADAIDTNKMRSPLEE